jgi:hypothetical protein
MRHHEPAEVVTLTGWKGEHETAVVVAAEEPLRGDFWMTATGSPSHRRDDCRPHWFCIGRAGGTVSPGYSLSVLPSILLILVANPAGADSELYKSVWVCSSEIIRMDEWQFTPVMHTSKHHIVNNYNWNPGNKIMSQIREMTVLRKVTLLRKEISLR